MARAQWTPGKPTLSTDADGTFHAEVPVLDGGVRAGTVLVTITAARGLEVVWSNAPGSAGLSDFRAWFKQEV